MDNLKTVDLNYLEQLRSFARPGGTDLVRTIVDVFQKNAPEILSSLEQALHSKDYALTAMQAHKLKSGAANVGAQRLLKYLDELENFGGKPREHEQWLLLFEKTQKELLNVNEVLNKAMALPGSSLPEHADQAHQTVPPNRQV